MFSLVVCKFKNYMQGAMIMMIQSIQAKEFGHFWELDVKQDGNKMTYAL